LNQTFIRLYSGKTFHYLEPSLDEVDIVDIAHSLSRIIRYMGHCHGDLTVAQHSCYCCDIAPDEHKLLLLLHDSTEAYCGDVNSILKNMLTQYQEMETHVLQLIARKFSLAYPFPPIVKEVDKRMLVTEMRDLICGEDYASYPWKPYDFKIEPWPMDWAEQEFLKRFHRYYKGQT
jgi:uncharacterized protein